MLLGLHHVTGLAGSVQASLDYYTQALKLRLVKRTVNFDDPGTHHLYFGDDQALPGTLLTFFSGYQRRRKRGSGQVVSVSYTTPAEAAAAPDDLNLQIVSGEARGLHSVTLCENDLKPTARFLAMLGFESMGSEGNRHRFELPAGSARIDVLHEPQAVRGRAGVGAIHHVALRVADEAEQLEWRNRLIAAGVHVSPVKDRLYFHSIYFREPGGALFEIATDGPGFLIDEPADALGSSLRLPPWLESTRESIEARLSPLELPQYAANVT
ncbi:MAG: Glyoxalase/bleomycin resistance protein/dioxygenase [Bryobacterales bacterium]|nr:Glyoxalase/bleomycin resistance protein/dioxygenase [Bryobacterales bacterium]